MSYKNNSSFFLSAGILNANPFLQLLYSFFLMLVSFLTITLLSLLLALPLFSISWEQLNQSLSQGLQNADIHLIRYLQITQSIGLFIIPGILLNYLIFNSDRRYIGRYGKRNMWAIILIFGIMFFSIPLMSKLIEWNNLFQLPEAFKGLEGRLRQMEDDRYKLTLRMLEGKRLQDLLFNIFMIAIIPALGEEFIFRGVLQQLLIRWFKNAHISIFISAFLFSSIHFQFYGFIPRLLLGLLFGYLFFWSRNIWWSIWGHFVNNGLAVILIFITNTGRYVPDLFKENHLVNSWEFVASFGLTILLIITTYKFSKRQGKTARVEN
jgi:membrane protease YdiL (CAAX protease family)